MTPATRDEWMTVTAARMLWDRCVCFVGIGLPSEACNLARLTHAPDIVLIYESGTIGTRPDVLPLSIGDGELAATATCVVSLPDIFAHYLQAGRAEEADVDAPHTRLPGAGGAPEIASHARQTFVMLKASPRSFVERLDFRTSAGYLDGHGARARSGVRGGGPRAVITDFGVLTPHPQTNELQLSGLFADASVDDARAAVGWSLALSDHIEALAAPTALELDTLRALKARTHEAHQQPVQLPAWTATDPGTPEHP